MTLGWLQVLSVLLGPFALGAGLLRLQGVVPRTDRLAWPGWAWLQGSLGVAVLLSAWLWLGWPLEARLLGPAVLGAAGLAFLLGRRVPAHLALAPAGLEPGPRSGARLERWLLALVVVVLLVTGVDRILLASSDVLVGSDEARIWAAKAKVMFHCGAFGPAFREALLGTDVVAHPDYPPLNPLLQLWVHAHAGGIVHVESRLPIQAFSLAGILLAAAALRRRARPLVAALFLVCIGTLGRFFTYQAFSDGMIAVTLLAGWDLWQRWREDGRGPWLVLLGSTASVLVWTKNEALLHVVAFALALAVATAVARVARRRPAGRADSVSPRPVLAACAPLVLSVLYLAWFNHHFGLANDLVRGTSSLTEEGPGDGPGFVGLAFENAGANLGPILAHFAALLVEPELTRLFVLAFLVLLVTTPRAATGQGRFVFSLGLVFALLGFMAVYLGTHWDVETHLKHSAHRLLYQLAPAAGLWVLSYVVGGLPACAALPAPGPGPERST